MVMHSKPNALCERKGYRFVLDKEYGEPLLAVVLNAVERGEDGADGKTPQLGTDYWTESDKAEIKAYIDQTMSESAGITVDQTVTESGLNPVSGAAVFAHVQEAVSEVEIEVDQTVSGGSANAVSGSAVATYVAQELGKIINFEEMMF